MKTQDKINMWLLGFILFMSFMFMWSRQAKGNPNYQIRHECVVQLRKELPKVPKLLVYQYCVCYETSVLTDLSRIAPKQLTDQLFFKMVV